MKKVNLFLLGCCETFRIFYITKKIQIHAKHTFSLSLFHAPNPPSTVACRLFGATKTIMVAVGEIPLLPFVVSRMNSYTRTLLRPIEETCFEMLPLNSPFLKGVEESTLELDRTAD